MKHTKDCWENAKSRAEWALKYPNYCEECDGLGEVSYDDDPSPTGVALSTGHITFTDDCTCIQSGLCPRCGEGFTISADPEDVLVADDVVCDHCGWRRGHPEDAMPPFWCCQL